MAKTQSGPWYRDLLRLMEIGKSDSVFSDFVTMAACALSVGTREQEYLAIATKYERSDLDVIVATFGRLVEAMEREPYTDLIGGVYIEFAQSRSRREGGGEFYTPKALSQSLARMTLDPIPEKRPITFLDPCCGAGGMVLACAEVLADAGVPPSAMRVTAVDVNRTACEMCYINCTLWGIPLKVVHGNTLSLETWGGWTNVHWPHPVIGALAECMALFEGFEPGSSPTLPSGQVPSNEEQRPVVIPRHGQFNLFDEVPA